MINLPLDEVHIWWAPQPSTLSPELETMLSRDECDRAARFQFAEHRLAYQFAHAILRDLLSRYLHCTPRDIRFEKNAFGKPFLHEREGFRPLEFNLSHAGSMVLIGVCRGRRIGIDVEKIRPIKDISAIAESNFTPRERAFIFQQHPSEQDKAFLRCWTRKEASVKAVGKGLSIPLNSFDTMISDGLRVGLLEGGPGSLDDTIWQLSDLDLPEGYVAALAVESRISRLVYQEWHTNETNERERQPST